MWRTLVITDTSTVGYSVGERLPRHACALGLHDLFLYVNLRWYIAGVAGAYASLLYVPGPQDPLEEYSKFLPFSALSFSNNTDFVQARGLNSSRALLTNGIHD